MIHDGRGEMALFIRVTLDVAGCAELGDCRALVALCPVDIFEEVEGTVMVVEDNVDECTLCELCMQTAPGAVTVEKLY